MKKVIIITILLVIVCGCNDKKKVDNSINENVHYEFGDPTTESTNDYKSLNKEVFTSLEGNQKSVCIIKDDKLICFKDNNYKEEKEHVKNVFGETNCTEESTGLWCIDNSYYCAIETDGYVYCSVDDYYCSSAKIDDINKAMCDKK